MDFLDLLGALFSLLAAVLYVKEKPIAWPISVLAIPIDIVLYAQKGIYADMVLQVGYFCSAIYGWYHWHYGGENKTAALIVRIKIHSALYLSVLAFFSFLALRHFLLLYANSTVPTLDALTTVLSLLAQWLMCRKVIEAWLIWLWVDILYFYLYWTKVLPMHCVMVTVYFCLAILGFITWQKKIKAYPQKIYKRNAFTF